MKIVKDDPLLVRLDDSNAIISRDASSYAEYKQKRNLNRTSNYQNHRLDKLESDISEIKSLLSKLIKG